MVDHALKPKLQAHNSICILGSDGTYPSLSSAKRHDDSPTWTSPQSALHQPLIPTPIISKLSLVPPGPGTWSSVQSRPLRPRPVLPRFSSSLQPSPPIPSPKERNQFSRQIVSQRLDTPSMQLAFNTAISGSDHGGLRMTCIPARLAAPHSEKCSQYRMAGQERDSGRANAAIFTFVETGQILHLATARPGFSLDYHIATNFMP